MSKLIGPGKTVTLHFSIKLEDGQIVDSNFDKEPATFTVGDGNLLEGFEKALFGLEQGMKQTLRVLPEDAFGMPNPSNIHNLPRTQFEDIELEQGLVISFSDPGNGELPGVIAEFDDTMVSVDFNHPLSGKKLDFEVQILEVS
ncbi:MAG: FKBP-type peptidyl-prolyl cis-trans isomerase [Neptuniibacter sp.]